MTSLHKWESYIPVFVVMVHQNVMVSDCLRLPGGSKIIYRDRNELERQVYYRKGSYVARIQQARQQKEGCLPRGRAWRGSCIRRLNVCG